jgi:RHS repeat-associated protein
MASTVGTINPIRYRSYYYDTETGFYYLQSRYYDPAIRRFINADGYINANGDILGFNMYAYCSNNPVMYVDYSGEIAVTTLILIGSIVAGVLSAGYIAGTSYYYTGEVDIENSIMAGLSTFMLCYTYGMSAYGYYVSYCNYKGYVPVTDVGYANSSNTTASITTTHSGPYSNLQDPKNVGAGKDFTAAQKAAIIEQNMKNNGGVVKSDMSGQVLVPPQKSMKGVTPSPLEWQIDHIIPKNAGGTNSYSNAQVLSRYENRLKWDNN